MAQITIRIIGVSALLVVLAAIAAATRAQELKKATYSASAGGDKWSIKYDDAGKVTVSRNGEVLVESTYKVVKDELEVRDEKGALACAPEQTGKYKWKMEGKRLVFTKVEDQCEGRATALTTQIWERE
ncbi:MAG TPA: hypothetical protein VKF81_02960 [Blastocatellia bacterium]|nr:hypothetical protein [Blastocatellia bacterium]